MKESILEVDLPDTQQDETSGIKGRHNSKYPKSNNKHVNNHEKVHVRPTTFFYNCFSY